VILSATIWRWSQWIYSTGWRHNNRITSSWVIVWYMFCIFRWLIYVATLTDPWALITLIKHLQEVSNKESHMQSYFEKNEGNPYQPPSPPYHVCNPNSKKKSKKHGQPVSISFSAICTWATQARTHSSTEASAAIRLAWRQATVAPRSPSPTRPHPSPPHLSLGLAPLRRFSPSPYLLTLEIYS
jgi:hypothetical protein